MSYENFRHYTEDELADLKAEFRKSRPPRGCSDRMCGAEDCPVCRPENFVNGVYRDTSTNNERIT